MSTGDRSRGEESRGKILSVDCRPIRDVGNAIGISLDISSLRDLGVVDDDGDVIGDPQGRQIIRDDGVIEIDLDPDTE